MPSKWIDHVKAFATKHKMSYRDALKDPKCKSSYKKVEGKGLRKVAQKLHGKGQGSSRVAPTRQVPVVPTVPTVQEEPSEANYRYLDEYPDETLFGNSEEVSMLPDDLDELIKMYHEFKMEKDRVEMHLHFEQNRKLKKQYKTEIENLEHDMQKIKSKGEKIIRRNQHYARG